MIESWKRLQNGTDIRGIAIATAEYPVTLTSTMVRGIGYGFRKWLIEEKNIRAASCKIAVGMDSRLSGPELKSALIDRLIELGCDVYDCGMSTTPAMFMTTILENYQCDGAVMITASHLPFYHNGLKFFTKEGGCEKEDIAAILENASQADSVCSERKGVVYERDLIAEYSELLVHTIRLGVNSQQNYEKPLQGCHIIVDAGNGAGGFFAAKVLEPLGADTTGSQFLEPDGTFPNHSPNPENQAAMDSLKESVLRTKADLGIIFDADVDRAAIVSGNGVEINRNALIALLSAIILAEHPQSVIVTDSITSTGLREFIEEQGGRQRRFKRGYKNVINEAKRLNAIGEPCHLAIETSGHAACKENYFLDDGAYLIAKILIKMAILRQENREIQSVIETLRMPFESDEVRILIKDTDFRICGAAILEDMEKQVQRIEGWNLVADNYDGIRIATDEGSGKGWFLLRISLHEPVLVLNIESDVKGGIQMMLDQLIPILKCYDALYIEETLLTPPK
jgi:phosphomannomutase